MDQGTLVNDGSRWNVKGSLIKPIKVHINTTICNRQSEIMNAFLPIPDLTKQDAVDLCKKFGRDVYIAGNFETIEDFLKYYEGPSEYFYKTCGFYDNGRVFTWLPYKVEDGNFIHEKTHKSLDLQLTYPWWKHRDDWNCSRIYLKNAVPTASIGGMDCLPKVQTLISIYRIFVKYQGNV